MIFVEYDVDGDDNNDNEDIGCLNNVSLVIDCGEILLEEVYKLVVRLLYML